MRWFYLLLIFPFLMSTPLHAKDDAVVHVVLFYSTNCPHCHDIMKEVVTPTVKKYGDELQLVMINIDTPEGQAVFKRAMQKYSIPKSRRIVPFMVIGSTTLVGSEEIKRRLNFLIEKGLSAGGRPLPKISGIEAS